ncbi:MAG: hypothetical protein K8S14_01020 [Actinomycetia bacterium]|nr:hypothetical protein [Actinomycetes bacterium]
MREEPKNRHGCLMAWLVWLIIVNSFMILGGLISPFLLNWSRKIVPSMIIPDIPAWQQYVPIALAVINVVFVVAIILWKKWGFWGYCASSIAGLTVYLVTNTGRTAAGINPAFGGIVPIVLGVVFSILGVLILFGVLHIGKEKKGWTQLK